jgi:curved DNA-binding protein CbpA
MTESFYDVLGVAEDATTDEIEAAYRERLKETHPDVSDDDDAGQATKTLIEARDVLVDEDERARYDRLGHDAYVGDGSPSASQAAQTDEESGDRTADTATSNGASQRRARREQRARERVRQERRKAREAGQRRREAAEENRGESEATASASTETGGADRNPTSTRGRRAGATDTTSATATGSTYSVRENVTRSTSHGPLLPQGRELTLFGIFFALYPVLLFSALLPAFPPFVNLVLTACTLLMIIYVQSMPRVSLSLFGGWSAISIVGLPVFGIGYLSAVGLVVLTGTVLPLGFSVLTASALRY